MVKIILKYCLKFKRNILREIFKKLMLPIIVFKLNDKNETKMKKGDQQREKLSDKYIYNSIYGSEMRTPVQSIIEDSHMYESVDAKEAFLDGAKRYYLDNGIDQELELAIFIESQRGVEKSSKNFIFGFLYANYIVKNRIETIELTYRDFIYYSN